VPIGVPGELHIGGVGLAKGYLNRPDLTLEKFINSKLESDLLYKTGDLARFLLDGNIEFLGRIDNQVKIRGFRIELAEIEAVLRKHSTVSQAVAIAREDIPGDRRLVAYVVANPDTAPVISDLRRFLKEKLPEYMVPAAFVVIETIPLTPNGKVNYRELPHPDISRSGLEASFIQPRNPIEEMLAQIWAEVLGVKQVGIHDNFFELGGHSLIATQLISRVRTALKVELPLRTIFEAVTVADLAERITFASDAPHLNTLPLQPVVRNKQLPLSFAQQRLWFLDQLEPNNAFYNIAAGARLQGNLNVTALEQSLNEIIRRHEVLRINFVTQEDGQAVQIIRPSAALSMPGVDLQHLPADEQETEIQRLAIAEAQQPFDLASQLLTRATLLVLSQTEHILLFCMHHIVSDAWSMGVFVQEIAAIYTAFAQGQPTPLPELPIQYVDFAVWQRQFLQGDIKDSQLAYWQQQLANAPTLLELPTDRPRPAVQSFRGMQQSFTISPDLNAALNHLSRKQGVTLFMTLLAAFDTLLYRYTGQADILVGSPIANRNHSEIEGLIGFFVNTLVLRTDLSGDPSFEELLTRVREMTLAAYSHQDLPFELLVEVLQPERNLSHTPLFQVAFVLQNAPMPQIELPELTLSSLITDNQTAKFDLTLTLETIGDELVGSWEYNCDLFVEATITRMTGHFQTLLAGIVADPEQPISQLPLLTTSEQQQLLWEWNDTQTEYPQHQCIHQLFEKQVERNPDAIAVVFADQHLTYRELNSRANQLAHYLNNLGVRADELVGLCVERSLEMVVGLLGILKAGGAYVPLDPDYPQERLSFMLEDTQIQVLLTQQQLIEKLPEHQAKIVCLDTDWETIHQQKPDNLNSSVTDQNLAYVIYTSGSTGKPKGVVVPHRAVNRLVFNTNYIQLTPDDRIAQAANAAFDATTFEIWGALLHGARLVIIAQDILLAPEEFAAQLHSQQISILFLTTALFNQLASFVPKAFSGLQYLLFGGEAVDPRWVQEVLSKGAPQHLLHVYGPTENTTFSSWYLIKDLSAAARTIPIGRPLSNSQIYLLDQNLQPVPIGVPGELHIGGDGLAQGYLNRPDLTQEKFILNPFERSRGVGEKGSGGVEKNSFPVPNPQSPVPSPRLYKTGDLARFLPDGNIEYLGRIDHQVKIRGFRIELGEIEAAVSQHPAVLQTTVMVREDAPGKKRLVAYLVTRQEQTPTITQLRRFLTEKLPEYMIPASFMFLEALPLTPNGKVDRRSLPAPESRGELEVSFVAPHTSTEEMLASIWADVLGVEQVGIDDNFFELGGDSILSLQIVARANQAGIQLTPKLLFGNQTIAQLAMVAGTIQKIQAEQGLVTGELPLTPIQHWFFEQNLPQPHHYNQSVLLCVPSDLKPELLEEVLQQLLVHHDALRLRFVQQEGWQQINAAVEEKVPLDVVDLSAIALEEQQAALETAGSELQASLNISESPLIRAALFKLGINQPNRLLLIIHHLAVDGVSWRILLEDLLNAYQQISHGEAVQLPPKTSSFKDWAERLTEYGQSEALTDELDYWLADSQAIATFLPVDYPPTHEANTIATAAVVSVSLSVEQTRILLQEVPVTYNTQINDVLLTALLQNFAQWTKHPSLLINLEGHGREDIFEDVDLSRTVGWFTSLFPVRLELEEEHHPGNALKSVKEQLRRIPKRGISYGVLRYLSQNAELLKKLPQPEVSFNYLGQFDQQLSESSGWTFAQESGGAEHNFQENRCHLLDISGLVISGSLQINWTYSTKIHQRSTIERLAQWFIEALQTLIDYCQSPDAGGYTPSDFPEAELSQEELDELMSEFQVF
ncbi:non-ribosomal peptide synthetase, partial [Nostoc sp. MG11]|uniref:non-ribosomal peptide synthetase n=1 Tax=Nostoc sp. MG11 TaxID=2721166 RepID=UPI0018667D92